MGKQLSEVSLHIVDMQILGRAKVEQKFGSSCEKQRISDKNEHYKFPEGTVIEKVTDGDGV